MVEKAPPPVQEGDESQRGIFGLAAVLFVIMALIGVILFNFQKAQFAKQSKEKNFSEETQRPLPYEMKDFETGRPRKQLDDEQLRNLTRLDETIKALANKPVAQIDQLFSVGRGRKK